MPFKEAGRRFKVCPECKKRRSIISFNKSGPGYRRSQCRECEQASRKRGGKTDSTKANTRSRQRLRYRVLQHYSGTVKPVCECCGEDTYEFLSIDHIEGNGNTHRKEIKGHLYRWLNKHDYPDGFRVLCHNCNQAIGFYGFCPHDHPDLSFKTPPPNQRLRKKVDADKRLTDAVARLSKQQIRVTARSLADAMGISHSYAEKRLAYFRKKFND